MPANTQDAYNSSLNVFGRECRPKKLSDLSTKRITALGTALRKTGRSPATVARHYRHLKAVATVGPQGRVAGGCPDVLSSSPCRSLQKGMRGRPITLEEFERMLDKAADVMGAEAAGFMAVLPGRLMDIRLAAGRVPDAAMGSGADCIVVDLLRPVSHVPDSGRG